MGVLGWTPETLYRASIDDMADAFAGFAGFAGAHGLQAQEPPVTRAFLDDMLARFPDRKKEP